MSNFHVLTLATKDDGYYNALSISAKNNHINLVTLGFGQKWTGFTMKINLMKNYIESLPDDDIVVISDAYDVIILQDSHTILNKFYSFNKPIVISRDANPNFLISRYFQYKAFKPCNNNYICAGLYMGYVWAIKLLYAEMCKNNNCIENDKDDQIMLSNTCNNNDFYNKYINIDTEYKIFYTTIGSSIFDPSYTSGLDSYISKNKLLIKNTNEEPSFVHGPNYTNLNIILKTYNLPIDSKSKRSIHDKLFVYLKYDFLKLFVNDVLILLLIIPTFIIFIHILKKFNAPSTN